MTVIEAGRYYALSSQVGRLTAPNPGPMTAAGTNTYLLSTDIETAGVTVVDPGPEIDEHIDALMALAGDRIKHILVTHTHTDHSPAAKKLAELTGAKVIGATPAPDAAYQDEGFKADLELVDDQLLDLNGVKVRAVHTPGHVNNHYCFLIEQDGMLLTGDHMMNGSTVVIIPPAGVMKDYIESLQKLKLYPLRTLGPGHGDIIADPVAAIDALVEHRLGREAKVVEKMAQAGPADRETLTPLVYDDVDPKLHFMADLSLWAHLIKLETEGRALQEEEGRWRLL
jgi:glyoxylase-like metal-dependent hydrolase (beta-lactamase superfamily II)